MISMFSLCYASDYQNLERPFCFLIHHVRMLSLGIIQVGLWGIIFKSPIAVAIYSLLFKRALTFSA